MKSTFEDETLISLTLSTRTMDIFFDDLLASISIRPLRHCGRKTGAEERIRSRC